ncbi:MAG: hypothetical protein HOD92_13540 [Deltaproteobacteria bacterium]|jgi:hypothetical protein|nr:hypothetical protein [Deltaproteobacteria bacterium]
MDKQKFILSSYEEEPTKMSNILAEVDTAFEQYDALYQQKQDLMRFAAISVFFQDDLSLLANWMFGHKIKDKNFIQAIGDLEKSVLEFKKESFNWLPLVIDFKYENFYKESQREDTEFLRGLFIEEFDTSLKYLQNEYLRENLKYWISTASKIIEKRISKKRSRAKTN